jgi:uncharacterized protein (DUF488 family)
MVSTLFTIGFTKTTAQRFFERIAGAGVRVVLDTRLNRGGQLAGFAKDTDLAYFLDRLVGATYETAPSLAPTAELLRAYRSGEISWASYQEAYRDLIRTRDVAANYSLASLDRACLLCSESTADHCHRRVAAEVFRAAYGDLLQVVHL